jgi:hypothetical protein
MQAIYQKIPSERPKTKDENHARVKAEFPSPKIKILVLVKINVYCNISRVKLQRA